MWLLSIRTWHFRTYQGESESTIPLKTALFEGGLRMSGNMICGRVRRDMYWVKLSDDDLSRYSNKIEPISLRKRPHYHCLTIRKWRHDSKRSSELAPHHGGKTAGTGIDVAWRNYVTVTLRVRVAYEECQCQCQSKIFSVARIAELSRSPRRRSRVRGLY